MKDEEHCSMQNIQCSRSCCGDGDVQAGQTDERHDELKSWNSQNSQTKKKMGELKSTSFRGRETIREGEQRFLSISHPISPQGPFPALPEIQRTNKHYSAALPTHLLPLHFPPPSQNAVFDPSSAFKSPRTPSQRPWPRRRNSALPARSRSCHLLQYAKQREDAHPWNRNGRSTGDDVEGACEVARNLAATLESSRTLQPAP